MKTFLEFLTALAVLAIVQHLAFALGILLIIVVVMSVTIYPRRTFAAVVLVGLFTLAISQPLACAIGLGAIALAFAITKCVRRQHGPQALLLTDQRER